jgi:hypothetical protein
MLSRSGSIVLLTLTCLRGQQSPPAEGARQLYYLATSPKDSLPPVAPASPSQTASPAKIEAPHLGLRYNIVLVDQAGHRQPVSADRVLHTGNCFGIDLHSNRSGYVYVFAKQSSGSWVPLLPSAEMPDETNVLDPSVALKIPKHHCFGVENPPGEETLFVVLSRNPRDFYELYEGYKTRSSVTSGPANHATGQHLQLAKSKQLSAAVQHLDERFGTRDISITKANTSRDSNEPAGSVYVVNTSARPTSSIVTKIVIRHR